ncbi:flagellar biosynthesis protein FlhA [Thiohalorhabdus methylotrophus]|uniref:Flagellar biosynthesis protein FlhA n=1 Tax=Thiohalorhabdus methylotrophus TaxID=3242694 RepID=A0ABV4TZG3_9GAMM
MAQAAAISDRLQHLARQTDILLAAGVVGILGVMVIPIPAVLLDLLISVNITLGIMILMVVLYVRRPLDFSVFPAVLLVTTLFRLALNVATTRRILLHGQEGEHAAGSVINAFGQFVVGGNYAVGLIIFTILVIVNFVVITKGATRVAEVSARFALDSMPGKQMSIDADLNSGLISEQEARDRRQELEDSSDFYGSMDGASKFVRGDAIAGILITLINVIGGLIIGTLQHGMPLEEAARVFTVLTVGDGLVSQIPALILSTGAGILVTRTQTDSHISADIFEQFTANPRVIGVASGVLIFLALMPGMPFLPFAVLGLATGGLAFYLYRAAQQPTAAEEAQLPVESESAAAPTEEEEKAEVDDLLTVDAMRLEVGYGLVNLLQSQDVLDRIRSMRRQIAREMGFVVPPIHIKDNLSLNMNDYRVYIRDGLVATGQVDPNRLLALDSGSVRIPVAGEETREPAFGLPALWIDSERRDEAALNGYTVVDPPSALMTHLTEVVRNHGHELLTRQAVQHLLDNLAKEYPKVVEEVVPDKLGLGAVQKILQSLLQEGVPIRDLLTVLETLGDYGGMTGDLRSLNELVRRALSRVITQQFSDDQGVLNVVTLDPGLEDRLSQNLPDRDGEDMHIDPSLAQTLLQATNQTFQEAMAEMDQPILLTTPGLRPHLAELLTPFIQGLRVISTLELTRDAQLRNVAAVRLND